MQKYDLFLILSHNLSETEAPSKIEGIKAFLVSLGAENLTVADLGRQKLAYLVKGEKSGYFVNIFFSVGQNKIDVLKNNLKLDNEVARFMLSLKKDVLVPTETSAVTSVFEKTSRHDKGSFDRRTERKAEKTEDKTVKAEKTEKIEKTEKKEVNLEDINKKIDEILQQDNFVV